MKRNRFILIQLLFALALFMTLSSCVVSSESPRSFEKRQVEREKSIETFLNAEILEERKKLDVYESLAYGQLVVYKPESFLVLDSLYEVRYTLSQAGMDREIVQMNLDKHIERQRAIASKDRDQLRYEIEHIYSIRQQGEFTIVSRFFYMDDNDSIILATKHYEYTIPRGSYSQFKNYLFEMHFTSPRDMYILRNEQSFIHAFKEKERELIGTNEHESFMRHTLQLMEIARRISTVDYVKLSSAIAQLLIAQKAEKVEIIKVDELIALENDQKEVVGYELEVFWWNKSSDPELLIKTTYEFDPFLRILNANDRLWQEED